MTPPSANSYLGRVVAGQFRIDRIIGQGSFAWVYHARASNGQSVAVKVLYSAEPTANVRFAREVQVLRSLPASESVVRYYTNGQTEEGWPFLVMEFVDGITLKDGMSRAVHLEPTKAVAFMAELCGAFVGLHQLGVAHRDVKPENILLARAGGIKLIDFGLIRDAQGLLKLFEAEDPLERRIFNQELDLNFLVGTPEYMAPEQFSDAAVADTASVRTDTWSDVFSLGVILFQLLSGQKPLPMRAVEDHEYPREMLRYMQWRIAFDDNELPRCPGVDFALDSVLRKAMRQDPRQRQPNAKALMDDLVRYQTTGRGVLQTDESQTCVVSINQLMGGLAPPAPLAPAPQPPAHRELPRFDEDEEDQATAYSRERPDLFAVEEDEDATEYGGYDDGYDDDYDEDDDDELPQGHTVVFFIDEEGNPRSSPQHPAYDEDDEGVEEIITGEHPTYQPAQGSGAIQTPLGGDSYASAGPPDPFADDRYRSNQPDYQGYGGYDGDVYASAAPEPMASYQQPPAGSSAPVDPWANAPDPLSSTAPPEVEALEISYRAADIDDPFAALPSGPLEKEPEVEYAEEPSFSVVIEDPFEESTFESSGAPRSHAAQGWPADTPSHIAPVVDPRLDEPLPPEPRVYDEDGMDLSFRGSLDFEFDSTQLPEEGGEADWEEDTPATPPQPTALPWQPEGPESTYEEVAYPTSESLDDHPRFTEEDDDNEPTSAEQVTRQVDIRQLLAEELAASQRAPEASPPESQQRFDTSHLERRFPEEVTRRVDIAKIMPDEVGGHRRSKK